MPNLASVGAGSAGAERMPTINERLAQSRSGLQELRARLRNLVQRAGVDAPTNPQGISEAEQPELSQMAIVAQDISDLVASLHECASELERIA